MSKWLIFFLLVFSVPAFALNVDAPLPTPAQEARAKTLFTELRCVVCQGEAIADSPADVARDMRREVRSLVAQGKKDDEIISYFVAQYGEKVMMMPSFSQANLFLWLAPLLVLLLGMLLVRRVFTEKKK